MERIEDGAKSAVVLSMSDNLWLRWKLGIRIFLYIDLYIDSSVTKGILGDKLSFGGRMIMK